MAAFEKPWRLNKASHEVNDVIGLIIEKVNSFMSSKKIRQRL
jgi:hypothetical protein